MLLGEFAKHIAFSQLACERMTALGGFFIYFSSRQSHAPNKQGSSLLLLAPIPDGAWHSTEPLVGTHTHIQN